MTDPLTPALLDTLEGLAREATPGPWHHGHIADDDHPCNCESVVCESYAGSICRISIDNGKNIGDGGNDCPPLEEAKANIRYIAACSPSVILALIEAARKGILK